PAAPAAGTHAGAGLTRTLRGKTIMSDFDTVLERLLTDPGFTAALAADPASALRGYRLSTDELELLYAQVSTDVGGQRQVEQRTSKASLFGLLSPMVGGHDSGIGDSGIGHAVGETGGAHAGLAAAGAPAGGAGFGPAGGSGPLGVNDSLGSIVDPGTGAGTGAGMVVHDVN